MDMGKWKQKLWRSSRWRLLWQYTDQGNGSCYCSLWRRHLLCAVKDDYTLWSWGDNNLGQLGNGTYNSSVTPVQIMSNVKSVCAGKDFALALTNNGDVYRWGAVNGHEVEGGNLPRKIADHVVSISAEYLRCSALKMRWHRTQMGRR